MTGPSARDEAMDIDDLARRVTAGERRALARAITLVESGRDDHRADAARLLEAIRETGREALSRLEEMLKKRAVLQ